jgi:magnesium-transporting ATPase (P-type)
MNPPGSSGEGRTEFDWKKHMPVGPIIVTFVAIALWLTFILFYALFWSTGFNWFQNIVVTIVSIVLVGLVLGATWMIWGMKYAKAM